MEHNVLQLGFRFNAAKPLLQAGAAFKTKMVIETEIKIGSKYRFVSQNIDEVVTITESPVKNSSGFLEYGTRNKDGIYRICFNDELFKLETSDSTCR